MLTPYGIFAEIHDATPAYLTVSPPETYYRPAFKGGHMTIPKWITGLALLGETSIFSGRHDLEYHVYVGNGESRFTTNESEQDDNPNKAVGFKLQFVTAAEAFTFGVAGYSGDRAMDNTSRKVPHSAIALHTRMNYGRYNLTMEFGKSALGSLQQISWYVQTSARIGRYTPYLRLQLLDPSESTPDDQWMIQLGGVNVMVTDKMFIKVEWDQNFRGARNKDIITNEAQNYGEFRAAVTLLF